MPRFVTEIGVLPLKPTTDKTSLITKTIEVLSRQDGFRQFKWGVWEEDENKVEFFINWNDITSHQKFTESADYPVLFSFLSPELTAEPYIIHVHFDEEAINKIIASPVVELATFFSIGDGFSEAVDETLRLGAQSPGCLSYTRADVVEELTPPTGGEKGKAHFAAIGWRSIEERWAATEREDVRAAGGVVLGRIGGYEVHHVRFQ
ncbi:hypothetical protein BJY04DRAFT_213818 [Aspergillus karnatakaensis]|uniref:uncharacterized protein n=1 Tax=Aspergillus karnatakaensis TaxID=1810916 RepID=UPI003CCD593C